MALTYLLDENLPGRFGRAMRRHNARGLHVVDFVHVGEPADLPRGSDDPTILLWAEHEGRILVTLDENTMPGHFAAHLASGRHSPGIFMIRPTTRIQPLVEFLVLAAHASGIVDWQDCMWYIP